MDKDMDTGHRISKKRDPHFASSSSSWFLLQFLSPHLSSPNPPSLLLFPRPPPSNSASSPLTAAQPQQRITISNSQSSLYEVLGVQMGSSSQEIKSAYRRLARVVHPDVASNGARNDTSAADEFIRIHAAYSTLSDPGKRADYDRTLFQRRSPVATSSFSGYTSGRSWETDQCW